jgi:hypothetical protein
MSASRIPALLRELADEIDTMLAQPPKSRRRSPVRKAPTLAVVPNELQQQRAKTFLRSRGLAK